MHVIFHLFTQTHTRAYSSSFSFSSPSQERRMQQQREALMKEKETAEKIAARAFAQSYLADLVPSVFGALSEGGFFYNPVERGERRQLW